MPSDRSGRPLVPLPSFNSLMNSISRQGPIVDNAPGARNQLQVPSFHCSAERPKADSQAALGYPVSHVRYQVPSLHHARSYDAGLRSGGRVAPYPRLTPGTEAHTPPRHRLVSAGAGPVNPSRSRDASMPVVFVFTNAAPATPPRGRNVSAIATPPREHPRLVTDRDMHGAMPDLDSDCEDGQVLPRMPRRVLTSACAPMKMGAEEAAGTWFSTRTPVPLCHPTPRPGETVGPVSGFKIGGRGLLLDSAEQNKPNNSNHQLTIRTATIDIAIQWPGYPNEMGWMRRTISPEVDGQWYEMTIVKAVWSMLIEMTTRIITTRTTIDPAYRRWDLGRSVHPRDLRITHLNYYHDVLYQPYLVLRD